MASTNGCIRDGDKKHQQSLMLGWDTSGFGFAGNLSFVLVFRGNINLSTSLSKNLVALLDSLKGGPKSSVAAKQECPGYPDSPAINLQGFGHGRGAKRRLYCNKGYDTIPQTRGPIPPEAECIVDPLSGVASWKTPQSEDVYRALRPEEEARKKGEGKPFRGPALRLDEGGVEIKLPSNVDVDLNRPVVIITAGGRRIATGPTNAAYRRRYGLYGSHLAVFLQVIPEGPRADELLKELSRLTNDSSIEVLVVPVPRSRSPIQETRADVDIHDKEGIVITLPPDARMDVKQPLLIHSETSGRFSTGNTSASTADEFVYIDPKQNGIIMVTPRFETLDGKATLRVDIRAKDTLISHWRKILPEHTKSLEVEYVNTRFEVAPEKPYQGHGTVTRVKRNTTTGEEEVIEAKVAIPFSSALEPTAPIRMATAAGTPVKMLPREANATLTYELNENHHFVPFVVLTLPKDSQLASDAGESTGVEANCTLRHQDPWENPIKKAVVQLRAPKLLEELKKNATTTPSPVYEEGTTTTLPPSNVYLPTSPSPTPSPAPSEGMPTTAPANATHAPAPQPFAARGAPLNESTPSPVAPTTGANLTAGPTPEGTGAPTPLPSAAASTGAPVSLSTTIAPPTLFPPTLLHTTVPPNVTTAHFGAAPTAMPTSGLNVTNATVSETTIAVAVGAAGVSTLAPVHLSTVSAPTVGPEVRASPAATMNVTIGPSSTAAPTSEAPGTTTATQAGPAARGGAPFNVTLANSLGPYFTESTTTTPPPAAHAHETTVAIETVPVVPTTLPPSNDPCLDCPRYTTEDAGFAHPVLRRRSSDGDMATCSDVSRRGDREDMPLFWERDISNGHGVGIEKVTVVARYGTVYPNAVAPDMKQMVDAYISDHRQTADMMETEPPLSGAEAVKCGSFELKDSTSERIYTIVCPPGTEGSVVRLVASHLHFLQHFAVCEIDIITGPRDKGCSECPRYTHLGDGAYLFDDRKRSNDRDASTCSFVARFDNGKSRPLWWERDIADQERNGIHQIHIRTDAGGYLSDKPTFDVVVAHAPATGYENDVTPPVSGQGITRCGSFQLGGSPDHLIVCPGGTSGSVVRIVASGAPSLMQFSVCEVEINTAEGHHGAFVQVGPPVPMSREPMEVDLMLPPGFRPKVDFPIVIQPNASTTERLVFDPSDVQNEITLTMSNGTPSAAALLLPTVTIKSTSPIMDSLLKTLPHGEGTALASFIEERPDIGVREAMRGVSVAQKASNQVVGEQLSDGSIRFPLAAGMLPDLRKGVVVSGTDGSYPVQADAENAQLTVEYSANAAMTDLLPIVILSPLPDPNNAGARDLADVLHQHGAKSLVSFTSFRPRFDPVRRENCKLLASLSEEDEKTLWLLLPVAATPDLTSPVILHPRGGDAMVIQPSDYAIDMATVARGNPFISLKATRETPAMTALIRQVGDEPGGILLGRATFVADLTTGQQQIRHSYQSNNGTGMLCQDVPQLSWGYRLDTAPVSLVNRTVGTVLQVRCNEPFFLPKKGGVFEESIECSRKANAVIPRWSKLDSLRCERVGAFGISGGPVGPHPPFRITSTGPNIVPGSPGTSPSLELFVVTFELHPFNAARPLHVGAPLQAPKDDPVWTSDSAVRRSDEVDIRSSRFRPVEVFRGSLKGDGKTLEAVPLDRELWDVQSWSRRMDRRRVKRDGLAAASDVAPIDVGCRVMLENLGRQAELANTAQQHLDASKAADNCFQGKLRLLAIWRRKLNEGGSQREVAELLRNLTQYEATRSRTARDDRDRRKAAEVIPIDHHRLLGLFVADSPFLDLNAHGDGTDIYRVRSWPNLAPLLVPGDLTDADSRRSFEPAFKSLRQEQVPLMPLYNAKKFCAGV
ncbi:unnamed protein product [Vitrella brassicaformis CCMP3155]|uniref:Formamidopyrimidine-DNA glycosylase catalytic domain-containing protein n=1 Tax=Vitrella brassicaformis (strain CCMP3155) TaxID=1169540 RepID=A0A0G4FRK4_VITBC|nr:unnamed protein product [Vitrella brassicaformis CCMP3155]|eukprot:CEM17253.1 unnamed protein product [Vitrella brassicaformis CCMP3155]